MDSPIDLDYIVENRDYIQKLGSALDTNNVTVKKQIFELFSALCTHNADGYSRAIDAIEYYQNLKKERYRFKIVLSELERENDVEYQVALLRFINCIINSTTNLQDRHRIRNEFIGLKLLQLLSDIRKASNSVNDIIVQLDLFDHHRGCDESQTLQDPNGINLNSPLDVFYAILRQVADTPQEVHFLSILQHLLRIDPKDAISDVVWQTTEKLVHRATLVESNDDSVRLQRTTSLQMFAACANCRTDGSSPTRKPSSPRVPHTTVSPRSGTTTTIITITGTHDHKPIPPPPPPPPNCTIIPPPPPPQPISNNLAVSTFPPLPGGGTCYGGPPPPPLPIDHHPERSASPDPPRENVNAILLPQQDTPTPKTKMKTINWGKISPNKVIGKQNIWAIVANSHQNSPMQGIDWNEMEDLFRQQSSSNHGSPKLGRDSSNDTPDSKLKKESIEITLLDGKRSLNVNIFLKQFRTSNEDIVQLIRTGDHNSIGSEKLRGLLKILPEVDEVDILRSFRGDQNRLGNAEKFLKQLLEIPSYKLRIESMLLCEEFKPILAYLHPCINDLIDAGEDLINNTMLREVLYMVVMVGNFLNSGGYAGNAAGVKLSSLQKLTDIRANKPGMNLIHYVAMQVEKRNPELLKFTTQMRALENASRNTTDQINNEIQTLKKRVEKIKKQVQLTTTDDDIKNQMVSFLEDSEHDVISLQNGIKEVEQMRLKLADFFCEDPSTFKLEECYKIFQTFCDKFKQAINDNERRQKLEYQASIRRQQRETSRKMKQDANGFDPRASPAFQRRQFSSFNCGAENSQFNENMSPDITPNGSLRRRRSRNNEDELLVYLETGSSETNLRERKSYGSLDRKRPRRRPESINVDFGADRERPNSPNPSISYERPSPVDSTSSMHTHSQSETSIKWNEDSKPRISNENRNNVENLLQTNDNDDKRKRRQFNANRRSVENETEVDRKLDPLPEEEKSMSPGPTPNRTSKPDISTGKNGSTESYKRVYQDWQPSKSMESSDIVGFQAIAGEIVSPQVNKSVEELHNLHHNRSIENENVKSQKLNSITEDASLKAFMKKLGGSKTSDNHNSFKRGSLNQENNATATFSATSTPPLRAVVATITSVHQTNIPQPPKPKSKLTKLLDLTTDGVISTNSNPDDEKTKSAPIKNLSNTKAIITDDGPQMEQLKSYTKLSGCEENTTLHGMNPKDTFDSLLNHHRNCNENYNRQDGDGDTKLITPQASSRVALSDGTAIPIKGIDDNCDIDNSKDPTLEISLDNSHEVEDTEANSIFNRHSITRRTTRRPKQRPTDYSSGNDDSTVSATHSTSITPAMSTTTCINNNSNKTPNNNNTSQPLNVSNYDLNRLKKKNNAQVELQIAPKKIRVKKFGHPMTTINQEDVQNAIRNLKSPTVAPEGNWFPQRDLSNANTESTTSLLSCQERASEVRRVDNMTTITKLPNHELNDEGFEETQSLVSDTTSHGKESNNSSCNEINKSTHQSLVRTMEHQSIETKKPSTIKPQTSRRFVDSAHIQKLNSNLSQRSASSSRDLSHGRRAVSSGPSLTQIHPRTPQNNQTVVPLTSYHGLNKIRSSGSNNTAVKRGDAVVERSGSRNSLRSSRSSINSAGSTATVRRMPVSITKPPAATMRSSSAHPSTSKRPLTGQNLLNGRIGSTSLTSTPRSGALMPTSRSSSSGSSNGHPGGQFVRKLPGGRLPSANRPNSSLASTSFKDNQSYKTRPREAIIIKTTMSTSRNDPSTRTNVHIIPANRSASTPPRSYSTRREGGVSSFMRPTTSSATKTNK